jgi:cell division protein FtsL
VKKNLQEAKEGNRLEEKPSATNSSAVGKSDNRFVLIFVYVVVILIIAIIIYYLTRYNVNTFKINYMG